MKSWIDNKAVFIPGLRIINFFYVYESLYLSKQKTKNQGVDVHYVVDTAVCFTCIRVRIGILIRYGNKKNTKKYF